MRAQLARFAEEWIPLLVAWVIVSGFLTVMTAILLSPAE